MATKIDKLALCGKQIEIDINFHFAHSLFAIIIGQLIYNNNIVALVIESGYQPYRNIDSTIENALHFAEYYVYDVPNFTEQ